MTKKNEDYKFDNREEYFSREYLDGGVKVEYEKFKKIGGIPRELELYTKPIPETPNQANFKVIKVLWNIGFRTKDDKTPVTAGGLVEMIYDEGISGLDILTQAKNLYGDHIIQADLKVGWFDVRSGRWREIKDAINTNPGKGYGAMWKNWPTDPPIGWGC